MHSREGHEAFSVVTGGRPQLPRAKGAGEHAEGASLPAIASRSGEAGGTPLLIGGRKDQAGSLGTEEKTSWYSCTLLGYVQCKQYYALVSN